jgi:hypothetical protein
MAVHNGDVLRLSLRWHGTEGQDIVNVWHLKAAFTATQDDQDVVDAVDDWVTNTFQDIAQYMPVDATKGDIKLDVVELEAWPEHPEGQPPWKEEVVSNVGWWDMDANLEPPYVGDFLPAGVAAGVMFKTARGRSPGKKFFGQIPEGMQTGSGWHNDLKAGIANVIADVLTGITITAGNTLAVGILSRATTTFLEFLSGELKDYAYYQRRRRPGAGG